MTEAQNQLIESLRPEAKEFVEKIMKDPIKTTKDNYGKVLAFVSGLGRNNAMYFLAAMVREGYPKTTAMQISQLI